MTNANNVTMPNAMAYSPVMAQEHEEMKMQTYSGSCHCGAVKFEVEADLSRLGNCTCSMCSKKGSLHHSVPPERFKLISGEGALSCYQFNKKIASHFFCQHCGIHTFSHPRTAPDKFNVNIRTLDDFDALAENYELQTFDGKNWELAFEARQRNT